MTSDRPVCWRVGGKMLRISIPFFQGLGAALQQIVGLRPDVVLSDVWFSLFNAESELDNLFAAEWFHPAVKNALAPGQKLRASLHVLTQQTDFQKKIEYMEAFNVTNALAEFQTVLRAELANADVYFVTRKAGFDTSVLISNAEKNFAADLAGKVPNAIPDIREAGKCLAFEMSTAAGFHVLRAVEAVVRAYWDAVAKGRKRPGQRNLGVYLKKMQDAKLGNAKVLAALQQIKDLHRNPLAHPEETLNLEEAVGLFGISQSAINAMLKDIPKPIPAMTGALSAAAVLTGQPS